MDGAGDDELRGRNVRGDEHLARRRLLHATLAAADMLLDQRLERIVHGVGGLHQPLLAAGDIGDHDRRAPRRALGIELSENIELHCVSREQRIASSE
jgi:hypothetical protein